MKSNSEASNFNEFESGSLGLPKRIINILFNAKITTVGQALSLGYDGLSRLPQMGKKSADQLWGAISGDPDQYLPRAKTDCDLYQVSINGKVILTSDLTIEQAISQIHFLIDRLQRVEAFTRKLADECNLFRYGSSHSG